MKKTILLLIIASLLVSSQVQASSFKKLNKSGCYHVERMNSGKSLDLLGLAFNLESEKISFIVLFKILHGSRSILCMERGTVLKII